MNRVCRSICLLLLLFFAVNTVWANEVWQQVDASTPFVDDNGIQRSPSCSGGPVVTPGGIVPANTDFFFFIREKNPRKLLIALDGGGSCWDGNTCIGSALAGSPIYQQEIDETADTLAQVGGIGDDSNPNNPFADYTQVFIPYCSADIHWGSKDTIYSFTNELGINIDWPIHHRGYDNLLAVLKWLREHYQTEGQVPRKVVLAGGSAGGYGVLLALPAVKKMLPPRTQTYLLADSANGVINDDFYQRAIGGHDLTGGVWGIENNIPNELLGAFASGPETMAVASYTSLAWRYPLTRFGQYTRAWDQTQIFYFNVMKYLDYPERWREPVYLAPTAIEWTIKARGYMHLTALAPNYRYYIAAGSEHTVLPTDSFYTENSAEGVKLSDWVDDMINQRRIWRTSSSNDWRNVSCFPNCL